MIVKSLGFRILVIFEPLNVQINTVLRLNELDIPPAEVNICLLVYNFCLLQQNLAILFFNINISHSHLLMKVFDNILNLKDILLIFFLLFQASHHKVSQLLFKVFTFFLLSFEPRFRFCYQIFQREHLIFPFYFVRWRCS